MSQQVAAAQQSLRGAEQSLRARHLVVALLVGGHERTGWQQWPLFCVSVQMPSSVAHCDAATGLRGRCFPVVGQAATGILKEKSDSSRLAEKRTLNLNAKISSLMSAVEAVPHQVSLRRLRKYAEPLPASIMMLRHTCAGADHAHSHSKYESSCLAAPAA